MQGGRSRNRFVQGKMALLSCPDTGGTKGSELECTNKELRGEWNLIGAVATIRGMNNPEFT